MNLIKMESIVEKSKESQNEFLLNSKNRVSKIMEKYEEDIKKIEEEEVLLDNEEIRKMKEEDEAMEKKWKEEDDI